jgi:hypothetical protein
MYKGAATFVVAVFIWSRDGSGEGRIENPSIEVLDVSSSKKTH